LALAVASEAHGAVLVSPGLPSIPELLSREETAGGGGSEALDWMESWDLGAREGRMMRARLYSPVAGQLYPLLGDKGVAELLSQTEASVRAAESAGALLISQEIHDALENAWRFYDWAKHALSEGDGQRALERTLRSGDALREVGPKQVARALMDRADEALRRTEDLPTYSEEELTRIRRLTNGAREALGEGDYPRAIRRAYYACQLLGAGPS
jgi:hypothetical protein